MSNFPVPSINFDTGVLTQDLLREYYAQLSMFLRKSVNLLSNNGYGIVDTSDPSIRMGTEQKPLWFEAVDKTSYRIYGGSAVTPSGDFVFLDTGLSTTVNLSDLSGGLNLFIIQYSIADSTARSLSITGQMVPNGQVPVTSFYCSTEASYLGLAEDARSRCVVIGAVSYSAITDNTTYLQPTADRPWIRNWFSFSDTTHRSYVGSGDVTAANPHGTSLADLSIGGLSIYDQLTSSGMVLSKDTSVSGVPGYFCLDSFTFDQIKTDYTGALTSGSFFGGTNVLYVELSAIPNTICGADDVVLNVPLSVDYIVGTRIVVLYAITKPEPSLSDPGGTVLTVSYTKSTSLMLNSITASSIGFSGIANNEIVISGGIPVRRLAQGSFPVRKYSSIPRNFRVFVDPDGFLIGDPGILVQAVLIADNQNKNLLLSGAYTPKVPVFVGIGSHGIGNSTYFTMSVRVSGIGAIDGLVHTETLVFNNTTYQDTTLPPALRETDQQVLFTSKSFSTVTDITVVVDGSHVFSGIQGTATLLGYAKLDSSKHRYALIASGFWNGREAQKVRDDRRVLPVVRDGIYGTTALTATAEVLVGANEILAGTTTGGSTYKRVTLICAEDFREPKSLDAASVLWEGREILDCPVISKEVQNSSTYKSCYRSRVLPLRKYDSELCGFVVILNSVENVDISDGSVRVVLKNDGADVAECVLKPMRNDLSGRIYIGYTSVNYRSAGFVISGRCAGFAAYFINSSEIDIYYKVDVVRR